MWSLDFYIWIVFIKFFILARPPPTTLFWWVKNSASAVVSMVWKTLLYKVLTHVIVVTCVMDNGVIQIKVLAQYLVKTSGMVFTCVMVFVFTRVICVDHITQRPKTSQLSWRECFRRTCFLTIFSAIATATACFPYGRSDFLLI